MAWKKFPYPDAAYHYPAAALEKNWPRLHRGDCEPFPADVRIQEAWRHYHAGEFEAAVNTGLACGVAGYNVANKAATIYAHYLETNVARKQQQLQEVVERCEQMQQSLPLNVNGWYLHALALGRYSQSISIAKALTQGLGGKIKHRLSKALEIEPRHADAHIALGAYHAEVIAKVGAMVGGLTYGANKETCQDLLKQALQLNPESAIARIEYANALVMVFGKSRMQEAEKLYAEAAVCRTADAMERLDVQVAIEETSD